MKKIVIFFSIVCGIILLGHIAIPSLSAEATEKTVILFLEDEVMVKAAGADVWEDAVAGQVLSEGDSLKTGADSWVEVGFGKDYKNAVRIKEMTLVELAALGPIKLGLLKGEVRSLVESLKEGSTFEIRTPTAVCGVRGTGLDTNTDGIKVTVDTYEEDVFFQRLTSGGEVEEEAALGAGKRGVLTDPATPIEIMSVPPDRIIDWYDWKKSFLERRAKLLKDAIEEKIKKLKAAQKLTEAAKKGKKDIDETKDHDAIKDRLRKPSH